MKKIKEQQIVFAEINKKDDGFYCLNLVIRQTFSNGEVTESVINDISLFHECCYFKIDNPIFSLDPFFYKDEKLSIGNVLNAPFKNIISKCVQPAPKEMTQKEIEEKLGYKIKIVSEEE